MRSVARARRPLRLIRDPALAPAALVVAGLLVGVDPADRRVGRAGIRGAAGTLLAAAAALVAIAQRNAERRERTARSSRQLDRLLTEHSGDGIARSDMNGVRIYISPAITDMLGWTAEELVGRNWDGLAHPQDRPLLQRMRAELRAGSERQTLIFRCRRRGGDYIWLEARIRLLRDEATGEPVEFVSTISDITRRQEAEFDVASRAAELRAANAALRETVEELRLAERERRTAENHLRLIADNIPAMLAYWDRDERFRFGNRAYVEYYDTTLDALLGSTARDVHGTVVYEANKHLIDAALAGEAQVFERTVIGRDGAPAYLHVSYIPDIHDNEVRGFFVHVSDVTELKRSQLALAALNSRLQRETVTDQLTGLPNRRLFSNRATEAHASLQRIGQRYGVIALDVDFFKSVNDRFGHAAGDDVLTEIARVLQRERRIGGDIAARMGGEEFAVLCLGRVTQDALLEHAERLRAVIADTSILVGGMAIGVTATFGVALARPDDASWNGVYRRADLALYDGKRLGRNRVGGKVYAALAEGADTIEAAG